MSKRRAIIRSISRGAAALLLAASLRLAFVQGWFRPVRVQSHSMWPALSGPLRRSQCFDCRLTFDWSEPIRGAVVCPNCGAENDRDSSHARAGDRLLVDRLGFAFRSPQRFELAVFRDENDNRWQVKRIVALPGERLSIEGGDLFVDGRPVRKTMSELAEMAILVHDAAFVPETELPERWRAARGWTGDSRWFLQADRKSAPLGYHHWLCVRNSSPPAARTEEVGPVDSYACNQGVSRDLFSVTDLLLACQLETSAPCVLEFSFSALMSTSVQIRIGDVQSLRRGIVADAGFHRRRMSLRVAVCDGRVLATLDGRSILEHEASVSVPDHQTDGSPIQIKVVEGSPRLSQLRVFRDLYHLGPRGRQSWGMSRALEGDEFFVLGDNVPISLDSRQQGRGVSRKQFVGTVLKSPFP